MIVGPYILNVSGDDLFLRRGKFCLKIFELIEGPGLDRTFLKPSAVRQHYSFLCV